MLLTGTATVGGTSAVTFTGTTTLLANGQVTANDTGGTTLAGNILESGGSRVLTAAGTGTLNLTNPNNVYAVTGTGQIVGVFTIQGTKDIDWEDLALDRRDGTDDGR